jgi:hypothetical protein
MNLSEFKAWFEGFGEGISGNPTEKQWEKIVAKVAEIKAEPTRIEVIREYVDRYRPWYQAYPQVWYGGGVGYAAGALGQNSAKMTGAAPAPDYSNMLTVDFLTADKTHDLAEEAFKAMGRSDLATLNS